MTCDVCGSTADGLIIERFGVRAHRCAAHSDQLRAIAYANEDGTYTVVRDGGWVAP